MPCSARRASSLSNHCFSSWKAPTRAARDLFVAAEIEEGVLEDGADHPHQVHFGRAGDAEDPAGGARRDQPRIAVDQIEPPARDRLVEQALGLGLRPALRTSSRSIADTAV